MRVKLLQECCEKCGQKGMWEKQGERNYIIVKKKYFHKECPKEIKEVPQVVTIDLIHTLRVQGHYDEANSALDAYHASRKKQKYIYERELKNRDAQIRRMILTKNKLCIMCGKCEAEENITCCKDCKFKQKSRLWTKKLAYNKKKAMKNEKRRNEKRKTKRKAQ